MRKSRKNNMVFVIELNALTHDEIIQDHLGRTIATARFVDEVCTLHIKNRVDAIEFRGGTLGKHFTIDSEVPCSFYERKLHFGDLILKGGPYVFQSGCDLNIDALEIDQQSLFEDSAITALDYIRLRGPSSISNSTIRTFNVSLSCIETMSQVEIFSEGGEAVCHLAFENPQIVQDVKIRAEDLIFNSACSKEIVLKEIRATFSHLEIAEGQYQFLDSQLQDEQQTPEQLQRFSDAIPTQQFHAWHRAQSIPLNEKGYQRANTLSGRIFLNHSTLLTGGVLLKRAGARLFAVKQSVLAAQKFQMEYEYEEENYATVSFSDSLFVSQTYAQSGGHLALDHSVWCVGEDAFVRDDASVTLVKESWVSVGRQINLNNVDWVSINSTVSSREFSATGNSTVLIEDTLHSFQERKVRWKADRLSSHSILEVRNIIGRFGAWGHVGKLEYTNFTAIVDRDLFASKLSQMEGGKLTLQSHDSYFNGSLKSEESTYLVSRDQCIVGENGEISLRGRVIGRFGEWLHLGKLQVEQDTSLNAPLFTAKEALLHKGSKVTGERFSMDVDDVTLSGEIDVSDTYRLITKAGMLKGSITSREGIDLAADYLLMNMGGRLNARDVRVVGNYLGFLGEVQARRSYSRAGGFMLDADLVLANNVMTTALVSASFGVKLPNPNSSLEDFLAVNNLIRAGLTVLNLTAPHVAPIANVAYFASKIMRVLPSLMQFLESGSFEQIQQMRPHQWLRFLSYLGAFGLSGYQEFAHFHLNEGSAAAPDFEMVMTRLLPAFISGEMNNSLLIVNSGLNLLPSSLNNAVLVEDAGVNIHVNDSVNAVVASHSGLNVAADRVETVDVEAIQGAVVSHIHTLFAHHLHIAPRGHEVVTGRAEWKVADLENEGTLSIHSSHHDSVLQVDHFDNQHKVRLTNVTVDGFQFVNQDHASEHLHDVAFRNTLHVDNGQTSYTGYYVIQTTHYTHTGERHALDTKAETIFSLKSEDAEFQGVVRDSKVHIEVTHLKNVEDFLQGRGAYADFHVITALELVTQQALHLHGLDRDCDISITAPDIHFDQDVSFDHNVFLHSTGEMSIDHAMQSNRYLFVEANGNVVLRSEQKVHTNPLSAQPSIDVGAKEGLYIKSDQGEVIGEGLHADGKTVVVEGEKDVTLDASIPNPADYNEAIRYELSEALANASPSQWPAIIASFQNQVMPSTPSQLEGEQVALVSHQGNVFYNGQARASDTIQFSAPEGHVTVQGALAGSNRVSILADTGFDLLSEKHFKYGAYGQRTVWDPSQITAGGGGLYIDVTHGDVIIDSSDMHAKGILAVQADNITSLAHANTYTSSVEHHEGFLGFSSQDRVTQTTAVFRSHVTSDSQVVLQARNVFRSEGGVFQGSQGTYLSGEHGVLLYDVVGHTQTVERSSAFWGVTYDQTTHDQEFNVSTSVFDDQQIGIQSQSGDVISVGSYIAAPTAVISGKNVLLYGRTLNNQWSHDSRGLHVSLFGIPVFSSHTTYTPFQYGNATVNNVTALSQSNGSVEAGMNTMSLGIDAYNTVESIQSGLVNGTLADNLLQQEGLSPSVEVGLQTTHQSASYQSFGGGGLYAENLTVNAQNRVLFDGLPVVVTYDAVIHAHQFDQFGTSLNAEYSSDTQDVTLGFTPGGLDHASFAVSASMSESRTFVNQQFVVGGHLDVDLDNWTLDGANTNAGRLTGHVSGALIEKTELSVSQAHSMSVQVSTTGSIGGSVSQEHSEGIDGVTSIHAQDDATIDAHTVSLEGAKITSDKKLNLMADTVIGASVQAHSSSDSLGGSGSVHHSAQHASGGNTPKHIDTVRVFDSGNRHDEAQQSVIYGEGGTNLQAQHIQGSVDTQDGNGSTVNHDRHWDYRADIPVGFESGGAVHGHPTEPFAPSSDQSSVSTQHDVTPAVDSQDDTVFVPEQADAVSTEGVDHVADRNDDTSVRQSIPSDDNNVVQSTINPLDFMEGSARAFSRDRLAVTPEDFEDRLPLLMDGRDTPLSSNDDATNFSDSLFANTSSPSFSEQLGNIWNNEALSTAMKVGYSLHFVVYQGYGYATQNLWSVFNWNWSSLWPQSFSSSPVDGNTPADVGGEISPHDVPVETAALNSHHSIFPEMEPHDSVDGSTVMFRKDKITISYPDFEDRMPLLMGESGMSSQRESSPLVSADDSGVISIYDVNRDTSAALQPDGIGACVYVSSTGQVLHESNYIYSPDDSVIGVRINATLDMLGHIGEATVGAGMIAASELDFGASAVPGWIFLAHGSDGIASDLRMIWTGEYTGTATEMLLEDVGVPTGTSEDIDLGISLSSVGGEFALSRMASSSLVARYGIFSQPSLMDAENLSAELSSFKHPLEGWSQEQVIQHVNQLGLKTSRDQLLLWSALGRSGAGVQLSQEYAALHGGITLEMTAGGRWLNEMDLFGIDSPFTRAEAGKLWEEASTKMIQQASGQVRSLVGIVNPSSIYRAEQAELLMNNKILGLDELNLKPRYGFSNK